MLALGTAASVTSANAAPIVPNPDTQGSNIVLARAGCGWGWHRNYRGFCVRDRHSYYRHHYRHGYYPRYGYYGGGYYRPHHYWYGY
jgi:hypothetical protein